MNKLISYIKKIGNKFLTVSLISLFSLIPLTWFAPGKLIFGHDMMPIIGIDNVYRGLFIVNDSLYGGVVAYSTMARIVVDFYFKIFQLLGFSLINTEKLFFVLVTFLGFSGSFLLFNKIAELKGLVHSRLTDMFLFLCSLFYTFNIYSLERWHELQVGQLILFYGTPLLFYLYIRICEKNDILSSLFFLLGSLGIFVVGLMNPADMVSIFSVFFILLFFIFKPSLNVKGTISALLILASCSFPFLVANYFFSKYTHQTEFAAQATSSFDNIVNKKNIISNILQFDNSYPRNLVVINDGKSNLYTWNKYYGQPIVIVFDFIFIITFFYILLFRGAKSRNNLGVLLFATSFMTVLFLTKGANEPFGNINIFLYDKVPLFWIFRSPDLRFMPILVMLICLILIYLFSSTGNIKKRRLIVIAFFVYIIGYNFYPIISRSVIEGDRGIIPSLNTEIPTEYLQAASILNNDKSTGKVLYLPTYYWYLRGKEINYTGWSFVSHIIDKMVFYHTNGTLIPKDTDKLLNVFFSGDFSQDLLKKMGIQYIIYDHNADINKVFATRDEFDILYKGLEAAVYKYHYKKIIIGSLELIKINDVPPSVYLDAGVYKTNLLLTKVNPTRYNVEINLGPDSETLNFLENFDQNWKLYLRPITEKNNDCGVKTFFVNYNVTQCQNMDRYLDFDLLNYFAFKEINNENHIKVNGFANGWVLDNSYVVNNFPSNYYQKMPDGSLKLNGVINYKTQIYIYISVICSIFLLLGFLIYLIIS